MRLEASQTGHRISGDETFDVNAGELCMKGYAAAETLAHPQRLLAPLVRRDGVLCEASWDEALAAAAAGFRRVRSAHGSDAVAAFGSGALTNEAAYAFGKFARLALETANFDYNGRFCMSSAAAAANRAFGVDRGLPFPLAWIAEADVLLVAGGNPRDTMPPLERYLGRQRARGVNIVVDPRETPFARDATYHMQAAPGTDVTLAYALLHVLIAERRVDDAYLATRTRGFAEVARIAEREHPERAERRTGVPADTIRSVARALADAKRVIVLTARGVEQHRNGTAAASAYINLALALGLPGREGSGYGTLTGQGNGQGGREHGQKSDQLPGYASNEDEIAVARVAHVWRCTPEKLRRRGKTAVEIFDALGGEIRGLFVVASNPAVSAPNAAALRARLPALDHLVVCDFFLSETAREANVVLPALQWAETSGTMTNLEGRVLLREAVIPPPPGPRSDLRILRELATRLEAGDAFPSADAETVFEELRRATRGARADYFGVTYARLRAGESLHWPVRDALDRGTPALFATAFATRDGLARCVAVCADADIEGVDETYPWTFMTGRLREHYLSGTQTRRIARLTNAASEPLAQLHPTLAARLGIVDGDRVRLVSRRGSVDLRAQLRTDIRAETIFSTFHFAETQSVNDVTSDALDPISRMPAFKACAVRLERVPTTG